MENSIEVTLDGYIDTLDHLQRLGAYEMPEDIYELFIQLVKQEYMRTEKGPYVVLEDFATGAETVRREDFEKKYPMYAKEFTWEEFVENECVIGNDKVAVVSIE